MTAIGRVKNFAEAIRAGCDVGQDNGSLLAGGFACANFEIAVARRVLPGIFKVLNGTQRRFVRVEAREKLFQFRARTFCFDGYALGRIADPTCQAMLRGKPMDEGPKSDTLDGALNRDFQSYAFELHRPLFFYLKTFEHHVRGIQGFHVHGAAFRADLGEMVAVKAIAAVTKQEGFNFIEFQPGMLNERMLNFYDVETETDVIGAVAGKGIEANFYRFDPARFFRGGFFFDGVHNCADEGNFVHRLLRLFFPAFIYRVDSSLGFPGRPGLPFIAVVSTKFV